MGLHDNFTGYRRIAQNPVIVQLSHTYSPLQTDIHITPVTHVHSSHTPCHTHWTHKPIVELFRETKKKSIRSPLEISVKTTGTWCCCWEAVCDVKQDRRDASWLSADVGLPARVLNEDKRRSEPTRTYRLDQKHGLCSKWYPMGSWLTQNPKYCSTTPYPAAGPN